MARQECRAIFVPEHRFSPASDRTCTTQDTEVICFSPQLGSIYWPDFNAR